jgi:hypothetical protein
MSARGDNFSLHKKAEALDQSGVERQGFFKDRKKRAASAALLLLRQLIALGLI